MSANVGSPTAYNLNAQNNILFINLRFQLLQAFKLRRCIRIQDIQIKPEQGKDSAGLTVAYQVRGPQVQRKSNKRTANTSQPSNKRVR
jgi:hypothetical protein